jgi:tetratricopeptide (TPR) repeat protein
MSTTAGPVTPALGDPRLAAALAHHQAQRMEDASALYGALLNDYPGDPLILHALGLLCHDMGDDDTAAQFLHMAISQAPTLAIAHATLATILRSQGLFDDAVAACQQAISLDSANVPAWTTLGNVLVALKRHPEAIKAFNRAIKLAPKIVHGHCGLGSALFGMADLPAALIAYQKAIRLAPDNAFARRGLGGVLLELGRLDEAEAELRTALSLQIEPHALRDLGVLCYYRGDTATSITCFRHALSLAPDDAELHFHLAAALLRLGQFAEGWAEYEWRRRLPNYPAPSYSQPEWAGESLTGRTILLYGEQGLGDCLQFAALAPAVAARGGRVILAVPAPLRQLFASASGVAEAIALGDTTTFDTHLPLLSVPRILGTRLDEAPPAIPYLHPEPAAMHRWAARLAKIPGLKVGVVWGGNPRREDPAATIADSRRSIRFRQLAPLFDVAGITWISLQKGEPAQQAKPTSLGRSLVDWMGEIDDFAETAALVSGLDLVITVDTSVAHLAGALGKPVWILSRFDGCWRWLGHREDAPWYPTARLFHQPTPGDWKTVVTRVADALRRLAVEPPVRP